MNRSLRFVLALASGLICAVGTVGASPVGATGGGLSPAAIAQYKSTHDTDPHVPLSASDRALVLQKEQAVAAALGVSQVLAPDTWRNQSGLIGQNQQAQSNGYYCGPASTSEALGLSSISLSQASAASLEKTTSGGTAWSGVNANVPSQYLTGYPVRDVLNYKHGTMWYVPVNLPYAPSGTDITNYETNVGMDVDAHWAVVGDAWEVVNGPHLTGHPNLEIFHYFTIIGYTSYATYTSYEDSATSVWGSVPAYTFGFSTSTLVTILGGRGYIW